MTPDTSSRSYSPCRGSRLFNSSMLFTCIQSTRSEYAVIEYAVIEYAVIEYAAIEYAAIEYAAIEYTVIDMQS